jgi:hypothetical protein
VCSWFGLFLLDSTWKPSVFQHEADYSLWTLS